jgi:hypothetical protein
MNLRSSNPLDSSQLLLQPMCQGLSTALWAACKSGWRLAPAPCNISTLVVL